MRGLAITMAVFVIAVSFSIDAFAMGGRRGNDGVGFGNSHHSGNGQGSGNNQGSGDGQGSGNHHGSENNGNHHEGQGDDDIVGDVFFGDNNNHDPFGGDSNDDQGDNDQDDDEENVVNSTFSLQQNVQDQTDNTNDPQAIPEPATIGLMLLGGAGAGLMRRKKKT